MNIVDTRYFREPETGRPHRVQVALDEDPSNPDPRKDHDTFAVPGPGTRRTGRRAATGTA